MPAICAKVVQKPDARFKRGAVRLDGDRVEQVDLSFNDQLTCTDGFYRLGKQVCPASALKVDVSRRAHYCSLDVPTEAAAIADRPTAPGKFLESRFRAICQQWTWDSADPKTKQKRIFLDLKFHDIPNTIAGACRSATRHGVDLLTIHATCGREALRWLVLLCRRSSKWVIRLPNVQLRCQSFIQAASLI